MISYKEEDKDKSMMREKVTVLSVPSRIGHLSLRATNDVERYDPHVFFIYDACDRKIFFCKLFYLSCFLTGIVAEIR